MNSLKLYKFYQDSVGKIYLNPFYRNFVGQRFKKRAIYNQIVNFWRYLWEFYISTGYIIYKTNIKSGVNIFTLMRRSTFVRCLP